MDNLQPYKISLDFYIRKIITVNAKQLDSDSRIINITCTENGKKFFVDSSTISAFVRYKKSDGHAVLNQIDILSDGTVNLELTQQMLVVEGRQLVDIMLINKDELKVFAENVSVTDDGNGNVTIVDYETEIKTNDMNVEEILTAISENGVEVLSTMSFYINTEGVAVDGAEIESSYEYNALIEGLGKMVAVDQRMSTLEQTINENETQRQTNEQARQKAESERVDAELTREIAENGEYDRDGNLIKDGRNQAEEKRVDAEEQRLEAEKLRNIAENGEYDKDGNLVKDGRVQTAQKAVDMANEATTNANNAAQEVRNVLNNGGIVLKSDIVHNLETEDENKVPDATQVKLLNEMIAKLQKKIDEMPEIYYDDVEPTSDIGKDGDIYMMLIQDETTDIEAGDE